jgi:amidase
MTGEGMAGPSSIHWARPVGRPDKRLRRDQITYYFGPDLAPALEVEAGEQILLETLDAASGRLQHAEDVGRFTRQRDPNRVNPATGPIAVRGAQPGDELRVEILDIKLAPQGYTRFAPGAGVMQAELTAPRAMMVYVEDGMLTCDNGIRFPARPMVGVIGTCPASGQCPTARPGPHGGNLDFNDITIGTVAHLPVFVPGGLLALGDLHASMGDGEVTGTAIEISGEVTIRVDLVRGTRLRRPWFETSEVWITYGHAPELEEAVRLAVLEMAEFLTARLSVSRAEAFLLLTGRGDVRVGQAARCGIDATARVLFPKVAPATDHTALA